MNTGNASIDSVLENINRMVASEGGRLEDPGLNGQSLTVRYVPGVNEECPECVPTHDAVQGWLTRSLQIHAPQVTEVTVS